MIFSEPEWLRIAQWEAMRGVRELPGRELNDERIVLYHQSTTLRSLIDEVPWCSSFACWSLEEAGIRSPRCAASRSFLEWGRVLRTPAIGCAVVLKRGGPGQPGPDVIKLPDSDVLYAPGHVGFYVGMGCRTEILVLGGNQSDTVCTRAYPIDRLLGYRWPA